MNEKLPKLKRNERLIYICKYLSDRPNQLVNFSHFSNVFQIAKSSLSEDIQKVREIFMQFEMGYVETIAGVAGGIIYVPQVSERERETFIESVQSLLEDRRRILPGNYVYLSDLLQNSQILQRAALLIAQYYRHYDIDVIMTIETQGVGLATMVAQYLNLDYVVVRRDSNQTSGPTISVNYVSGSHQTVKKMELTKSSLTAGNKVLIVDDFIRHGGTVQGLMSLIDEFDCEYVGTCVFAANTLKISEKELAYQSLFKVDFVFNEKTRTFELKIETGGILEKNNSWNS